MNKAIVAALVIFFFPVIISADVLEGEHPGLATFLDTHDLWQEMDSLRVPLESICCLIVTYTPTHSGDLNYGKKTLSREIISAENKEEAIARCEAKGMDVPNPPDTGSFFCQAHAAPLWMCGVKSLN